MPIGGIIRSAPKAIRQVHKGFYGAGCPHLGVEILVEQLNKLLMHYGCKTSVCLKIQFSLELLTLEWGFLSSLFMSPTRDMGYGSRMNGFGRGA